MEPDEFVRFFWLQRGRPRAGAEIIADESLLEGKGKASTGPPPRGGGNCVPEL